MANRYWVGGTGTWDSVNVLNWSLTSGGVGGATVPGAADAAIFNESSGGGLVTIGENVTVLTCTFSAFTGSVDNNNKIINIQGNAATVYSHNTTISFSNNPTVNLNYSGATGTRTVSGRVGVSEANAVSVNITAGSDIVNLSSSISVYKNVNFTGFSGTVSTGNRRYYGNLTYVAGLTLTSGSFGTHFFSATSGTQTITMAGKSPDGPFTFDGVGGTYAFTDALVIPVGRALTFSAGTLKFKNGTTNSFGSFATTGSTQKTLQSSLDGSQAILSQASGTVNTTYLTIQDINATGGATWNALYENQNIDAGGNTGWNFGGSPQTVTEVTYALRSFTTPRRF